MAIKPNESRFSTLVVAKSAMEMDTNAPRGGALRNIAKRASGTWGRISEEYNMVRHSIEEEIARLTKLMNHEIEARMVETGIIKTCDEMIEASGRVFEDVYLAVFNLILFTDEDHFEAYSAVVTALKRQAEKCPFGHDQTSTDLVTLYEQAATVHEPFEAGTKDHSLTITKLLPEKRNATQLGFTMFRFEHKVF